MRSLSARCYTWKLTQNGNLCGGLSGSQGSMIKESEGRPPSKVEIDNVRPLMWLASCIGGTAFGASKWTDIPKEGISKTGELSRGSYKAGVRNGNARGTMWERLGTILGANSNFGHDGSWRTEQGSRLGRFTLIFNKYSESDIPLFPAFPWKTLHWPG